MPYNAKAPARTRAIEKQYKNNHINRRPEQGKFDRSLLPSPADVLQKLGIKPGKINAAGYFPILCPFHMENHPSCNIHSVTGHYRCHSCAAHGGDVLAFYQQVTGKSFSVAARDLKAWGNSHE